MIPGPDEILACPVCGQLHRLFSLRSGNTFGARCWTDGKVLAPMSPPAPWIARCSGCGQILVVAEMASVGTMPSQFDLEPPEFSKPQPEPPRAWVDAPYIVALSEGDLLELVSERAWRDRDEEIRLRLDALQAGNDAFRQRKPNRAPNVQGRSDAANDNLRALHDMLHVDDQDERLLKAETARELGQFDEARALLNVEFSDGRAGVAAFLRELAEAGDSKIRFVPDFRRTS